MEATLSPGAESSLGGRAPTDVDARIRSRWAAIPPDPVPLKAVLQPKRRAITPAALKAVVIPSKPTAAPKPARAAEETFLPLLPILIAGAAMLITGLLTSVLMGPAWMQGAGAFGAGVILAVSLVPLRRTEGCSLEVLSIGALGVTFGSLAAFVLFSVVLVEMPLASHFSAIGLLGLGLRTLLLFLGVRAGLKATRDDTLDFA